MLFGRDFSAFEAVLGIFDVLLGDRENRFLLLFGRHNGWYSGLLVMRLWLYLWMGEVGC